MEVTEIVTEIVPQAAAQLEVTPPKEPYTKQSLFVLEGADLSGPLLAYRKLSDFCLLRSTLLKIWPGVCLPVLATSKLFGKDPSLAETTLTFTDFMNSISNSEFLYDSDEFQLFLRGPEDFERVVSKPMVSYHAIGEVYKVVFTEYIHEVSEAIEEEILNVYSHLESWQKTLERISKQLVATNQAHVQFESQFLELLDIIERANEEFSHTEVKEHEWSYHIVSDWLRDETLDLMSIQELILHRAGLEKTKNQLLAKTNADSTTLEKMKSGKFSFAGLFTKDKEGTAAQLEENIRNAKADHEGLKQILEVMSNRLHTEEIPSYLRRKKQRYNKMLQTFAVASMKDFKSMIDFIQLKFNDSLI